MTHDIRHSAKACWLVALLLAVPLPAAAEEASAPAAPPEETKLAADFSYPSFQIGADIFGGPSMAGTEFIAGVNATIVFPVLDFLWVGIRPALHYSYSEDNVYETTWLHPDVAVQVNILNQPLRVYGLLAGGYLGALDGDLHGGMADGWSLLAAAGAAWKYDGPLGIFIELGFRAGSASQGETVLDLDANGQPQCTDLECQSYKKMDVTRTFDLYVFTINLGVCYTP